MAFESSRVFSIPSGAPFLASLADALLDGALVEGFRLRDDPLLLADSVVFLPTRRSVKAFQEILVERLGGAALLPRIAALGDVDEEMDEGLSGIPDDQHVMASLERRLVLARLVRRWALETSQNKDRALIAATAPEALHFATQLAALIDSFETEGVRWESLSTLVPENHAAAWDEILAFLKIAAEWWPEYLSASKSIGAFEKRRAELAAIARHLGANPPRGVIVGAGSTGSAPATASLLVTIASLPTGAVVLPGLDQNLDAQSWARLENDAYGFRVFTHPQRGLNRLLQKLATPRANVREIGRVSPAVANRQKLVSSAMRPAETTDQWAEQGAQDFSAGLAHMTVLEPRNERLEALCIALLLRQTLESKDKTAALITPDRALAKSVAAELSRWGIDVDDSAGQPLFDTPAGIFALLLADAAASYFSPSSLLQLFRHPLFCPPDFADCAQAIQALELGVLRGPEPAQGAAGLHLALAENRTEAAHSHHVHPTRKTLKEADWALAAKLIDMLDKALNPATMPQNVKDYGAFLHHALSCLSNAGIFDTVDGEALQLLLKAMQEDESDFTLSLQEFPSVLRALMQDHTVRPLRPSHPQIAILGLLEARLLHFDRVVLGGLVEGNWPPDAHNDPWLSRPMRAALTLPPPEWRLGLTAHDFEEALGRPDVILSRPLKKSGTPTVPARWLLRLEAVAGKAAWETVKARGKAYEAWAEALDKPAAQTPLPPPEPRPSLSLRPARLSVTEVEKLIRDPYHVYAHKILKLQPLDAVGLLPSFSERGSLVHDALEAFTKSGTKPDAPHALDALLQQGNELLEPLRAYPHLYHVWSIQFKRIARAFLEWETERAQLIAKTTVETRGTLGWKTAAGRDFTLSARADRIDTLVAGGYAIVDYKTGMPPSAKQVFAGFAPQLTLEAAMVQQGGFPTIPAAPVDALLYLRLSGGLPPLAELTVEPKREEGDADPLQTGIRNAIDGVRKLVDDFENPDTPYLSNLRPQFLKNHAAQPYRHLARVDEWGLFADEDGDDA